MKLGNLYDNLSEHYNGRYEQSGMPITEQYLRYLINECGYRNILEIGCGTGHWLNSIFSEGLNLFGLDLSFEMLKKGRYYEEGSKFNLIHGDAENLPLKPESFDLIFVVNAIHHFSNPQQFIRSASKLLNSGGTLAIEAPDIEHPAYKWYVYDYFTRAKNLDKKRIPPISNLIEWFAGAALFDLAVLDSDVIPFKWDANRVFEDHFLRKEGNSTLALLTEREYKEGIRNLKKTIETNPDIKFESNIIFKFVSGRKKSKNN